MEKKYDLESDCFFRPPMEIAEKKDNINKMVFSIHTELKSHKRFCRISDDLRRNDDLIISVTSQQTSCFDRS